MGQLLSYYPIGNVSIRLYNKGFNICIHPNCKYNVG